MKREIPKRYQALYERAVARKSRVAAIRSQCLECVGYSTKEVKLCTDTRCPLYSYRLTG